MTTQSSLFALLDQSLRRMYVNSTGIQVLAEYLINSVPQTSFSSVDFARSLREAGNRTLTLLRQIAILEAAAQAMITGPVVADEIAAAILSVPLPDESQELYHLGLTRFIENTDPETIRAAIREVASLVDGKAKLEAIQQALEDAKKGATAIVEQQPT